MQKLQTFGYQLDESSGKPIRLRFQQVSVVLEATKEERVRRKWLVLEGVW